MPEILIVADDLTGAADSAIACAEYGLDAVVVFDGFSVDADVVAVDADTRRMTPDRAAEATAKVVGAYSGQHLFKKVDSTLSGHIVSNLRLHGGRGTNRRSSSWLPRFLRKAAPRAGASSG